MKEIFENLVVPKRILRESQAERDYALSEHYERLPDRIADAIIDKTVDVGTLTKNLEWKKAEWFVQTVARLVLELRNDIDSIDTIIGDDASGRLPALLIREVLDISKKSKHRPEGGILFVAGGKIEKYFDKEERIHALKSFIEARRDSIGKVLFVTEHISSGEGIKWVMDIFDEIGVDYRLATVSVSNPEGIEKIPRNSEQFRKIRYGYGGSGFHSGGPGSRYAHNKSSSGVRKIPSGRLDSVPPHLRAQSIRQSENDSSAKKLARADMKYLARELSKLLDVEV